MQPVIIAKIKHDGHDIVLNLPCKDSELQAQHDRLTEDGDARFYLSAIEPKGLTPLVGLEVDLDELNFLAKSMARFTIDEEAQFFAAVQLKPVYALKDMINLSFNLERYTVIREFTNLAQIGRSHTLNVQGFITPEELETLDFAEIGRRVLGSSRCIPTDYGLLHENLEVPVQEVYNGSTFPCYFYWGEAVALCTLHYNGQKEYLYLPEEEISINKALGRLGADSLDACKIELESSITAYKEWQDWLSSILEHEGLDALNILAHTLDQPDMNWEKLTAVVHYADVVSGEDMGKLARHLDDFVFIKGAETDEDVGRHFVEFNSEYHASLEVIDYLDFDALGRQISEDREGQFMDGGFVCMDSGCSLEVILDPANDFTMGGY